MSRLWRPVSSSQAKSRSAASVRARRLRSAAARWSALRRRHVGGRRSGPPAQADPSARHPDLAFRGGELAWPDSGGARRPAADGCADHSDRLTRPTRRLDRRHDHRRAAHRRRPGRHRVRCRPDRSAADEPGSRSDGTAPGPVHPADRADRGARPRCGARAAPAACPPQGALAPKPSPSRVPRGGTNR